MNEHSDAGRGTFQVLARGADFLQGGGQMGALMRAHDWSRSPLGAPECWQQSLRTSVSTCLDCAFPILIWWGPELVMLYNDEYRSLLGSQKHPAALGAPGRDVWPEIWDVIGPMLEQVIARGEATRSRDLPLFMDRHGYLEETYFSFSYSPIRDETGGVGGVFTPVIETTAKVVGERRMRTLRDLAARGRAESLQHACRGVADVLAENPHDVPFALIYQLSGDGRSADLLGAAGVQPGGAIAPVHIALDDEGATLWPIPAAAHTVAPIRVALDGVSFADVPRGAWPDPPRLALVLPVTTGRERPTAVLICGANPRRALDGEHQGFFELMATQLGSSFAETLAYEDERRRAETLAELDRAKTAFFANVSHEFRTPLTLMLGPLEDVLSRPQGPSPADRGSLEIAQRNALRLLKLVNSLLEFSRIEAGRMQAAFVPTDLARLTEEIASVFRSAIEAAGLRLIVDCPPLQEPAYVDREMWEKIVLNLLSNAFKFTFAGEIEAKLRAVDDTIELTVRDTGTGIPQHELPKLFERFHRVAGADGRTHEGSGIGLALVQELAKLHGGSVGVASALGRGSVFTVHVPQGRSHLPPGQIDVPAAQEPIVPGARAFIEEALHWLPDAPPFVEPSVSDIDGAASSGQRTVSRTRILLADDNADMRDYVRRLLATHYDVEAVGDGEAALAAIARAKPDLVLSDVMMPRLDGIQLLARVRADAQVSTIPVILLSARAGEESRVEGMQAGADDYLIKPFSARELLARVEAHLKMARLRAEATERLRASEERFRAFVTASSDIVYRMSPDWTEMRYLQGKDFIADTMTPSQRWLAKYIHPDDQPEFVAAITGAIDTKSVFELEHRVIRIDGTLGWAHSRAIPVLGSNGEIVEWFGAAREITEQKQAEYELRKSEERLRSAVEVGRLGLWDWNVATGEVYWSDEHFRMEGYGVGEVTPSYEAWTVRLHPEDRGGTEAALRRAMEAREEYVREFRVVHPNGAIRYLYGRGRFFYDDAGQAIRMTGAMLDVTERREWEERQKVLVAELQHRTRNLLAVVRAMADKTARASTDLADFRARYRDRLETLSRVQGLLSRLNEHDRVTFDDLIRSELSAVAGGSERVELAGPSGVRLRSSTVQTLAMALHELATNAVKYGALAQPSGHLAVLWSLERHGADERPWLHIDWRESGVDMPPPGVVPGGTGQGRELIEQALPYQLSARTSYTFAPDGVRCTISIPVSLTTLELEEHA
ncbi:putative sensor histidine kinase with multiple PAS/PAC and a response regulator receiver domain [Bradyrhizobium sp. ORS 285]|uniref:PAS domain-containing protein n=1 Tax=Bradyrhizobium sp. ORS 285 TaxID=115808 RepID=UPI00024073E9|nr:PAS domain-containing protein [Bradyrhizobium sp. ORS 285]CCD90227.1 putative sensor histidine kinase with multiple PAS/PAC and a response regulator receiver domain [Bradyrhizobium sp. ORS 285]SMX60508.1 putative sensor histidine kinase with multiple PAS/PAC and a response regulator receiver domain [Bradyrhizobium sp. ORS 285]